LKKKSVFEWIIDAMAFLAGMMLVALVLIVSVEIGARYFFQYPLVWTVEVCEYLLFSMAFFGAPWLLKVGGHVNIDIFIGQFGEKAQQVMNLFSTVAGGFVSGIIVWTALKVSIDSYKTGVLLTKTISIPQYPFMLLIAFGYLCLLLEFARQFWSHLKKFKEVS
jgi:TRAP-type C4-dicarboxylate transport system permease small subunit